MFGFRIWRVDGQSMLPAIPPGSFALVRTWFNKAKLKPQQKLLIKHRRFGYIVKTLVDIDADGQLWCRGENDASVTMEQIGHVNPSQVLGQIVYIFKPN
ncbi:hypothetical protein G3R49_17125 [Shewanella sp. WXL01]|uniref:Nickel-type superoxide dismutase maturation protease n=1 Tax=Shewanella maritima TaxID=2520507 RepID=A0A411PIA4_9GAMM|nr:MULTISPECIES: S24/S26 family peptidase [Shewanella]NKF52284.1 hypothetical protein [Shewanella sp. WXL01]QBF83273.1 hypothetical protein EXU30_11610 [Shewanella maritima]